MSSCCLSAAAKQPLLQLGGTGGDDGAGPAQEWMAPPQILFPSHTLMLLLAHLFLQAPIPCDSSNTKQTWLLCNTHIQQESWSCVRHLSNKPSPLFLDCSHSPLTALLPAWLVGYHQLGQSSCRESGMLTRPGGHTLLSSLLAAAGQSTELKAPC